MIARRPPVRGRGTIERPEDLRVGLDPVVEERRSQAVDGRPLHPKVGVAPLPGVAGVTLPFVGDADPTGERRLLVDDEQLAVRPVVDLPDSQLLHRSEPPQLHAGILHEPDRRRVDQSGAKGVEQHAHAHTCLGSVGE